MQHRNIAASADNLTAGSRYTTPPYVPPHKLTYLSYNSVLLYVTEVQSWYEAFKESKEMSLKIKTLIHLRCYFSVLTTFICQKDKIIDYGWVFFFLIGFSFCLCSFIWLSRVIKDCRLKHSFLDGLKIKMCSHWSIPMILVTDSEKTNTDKKKKHTTGQLRRSHAIRNEGGVNRHTDHKDGDSEEYTESFKEAEIYKDQ